MANKKISEGRIGLTETILRLLESEVRVIGLMLSKPSTGYMIQKIDQITSQMDEKYRVRAAIKRLEKQGYIRWKKENNKAVLILEPRGKQKIKEYDLNKISLKKTSHWDGMYRVIIFDIPEKKKNARENLRRKLKELEFYRLQKSVFVSPYECRDEIGYLGSVYGIEKHIQYMLVKEIPNINSSLWFV